MKEFIIWGIKDNALSEIPLFTKCKNKKECFNVIEILRNKYNCKMLRVQEIDLNKSFNFVKEVLK